MTAPDDGLRAENERIKAEYDRLVADLDNLGPDDLDSDDYRKGWNSGYRAALAATPAAEPGLREAAAGVRSLAVEGASLLHLSGAGIVGRHNGKWTECEHGRCVAYRERIAALDRALAAPAESGL